MDSLVRFSSLVRPRFLSERKGRLVLGAPLLSLAVLTSSANATGQPQNPPSASSDSDKDRQVRDLMRTGIEEYRKQNLEAAYQSFHRAFGISRHAAIAASLAEVEMKLGRYAEAAEHWEFYLNSLAADRVQDRADAEAQLAECSKHVARVEVVPDPLDASVFFGEVNYGKGPAKLWLSPGEHRFKAQLDGQIIAEEMIVARAGETLNVRLAQRAEESRPMPRASTAVLPADSAVGNSQDDSGTISARTFVLIGGGVLTAAAVGVGVGHVLAANRADDRAARYRFEVQMQGDPDLVETNSQCSPPPGRERPAGCDGLARAINDRTRMQNIALGSFIAGGVLGVATIATFLLWPDPEPKETAAKLTVGPWLSTERAGADVWIRF